ncbi:hypothetical protein PRA06_08340 [Xylella fastidiosa subsp. multiplex]|nr:hypothetical protein M233_01410 [Xylella fastidiosa subsp. multiplex Griffin-1]MDC7970726.1 hypothetical protein [Xylella fastidiosa subsp. multiplex]
MRLVLVESTVARYVEILEVRRREPGFNVLPHGPVTLVLVAPI